VGAYRQAYPWQALYVSAILPRLEGSDAMEKLVEKVMEQIRKIVDETIDQEVGDDLKALRMQGELYRAIANECLCEGNLIIAGLDYLKGRGFTECRERN
jgi:hypothetical protein